MKEIKSIDDIKSGYLVELRNGKLYMCMRHNQNEFNKVFINVNHEFVSSKVYNSNLCCMLTERNDIMKVWGLNDFAGCCLSFITKNRPLLYKRNEAKEMTLKQIEDILGYSIKIVKE